jgi:hypothetical protein
MTDTAHPSQTAYEAGFELGRFAASRRISPADAEGMMRLGRTGKVADDREDYTDGFWSAYHKAGATTRLDRPRSANKAAPGADVAYEVRRDGACGWTGFRYGRDSDGRLVIQSVTTSFQTMREAEAAVRLPA